MIALGCDHGGYALMQEVIKYLDGQGQEYKNFGTYTEEPCDYPEYAEMVAQSILSGECDRGILICGTGIGITMAANRFSGIRAANCTNCYMAESTRLHNDANILGLGGRVIGTGTALKIVETFLGTPFSGEERHVRRIEGIEDPVKKAEAVIADAKSRADKIVNDAREEAEEVLKDAGARADEIIAGARAQSEQAQSKMEEAEKKMQESAQEQEEVKQYRQTFIKEAAGILRNNPELALQLYKDTDTVQ